ncbi:hypothetical protein [Photobacterium sanguinicancri]|uniref:hypothetical protein n=1 Tax=Photobacterium sanguinicancri TaxID=875932 RepID=UPI003D0E6718
MRFVVGCALLLVGCSSTTNIQDQLLSDIDYPLSKSFESGRFESVVIQPYIQFGQHKRFYEKTTLSQFKRLSKARSASLAVQYADLFDEPLDVQNRHLYQYEVKFGDEVGQTKRYFYIFDTHDDGARWVMNIHHDGMGAEMMFPTKLSTLDEGMAFTATYDLQLSDVVQLAEKQKDTLLFPVTRLVNALDQGAISDDDFADDAFSRSITTLIDYEGLFPIGFSFKNSLDTGGEEKASVEALAQKCTYTVTKTFQPQASREALAVEDLKFETVKVNTAYEYTLSCNGRQADHLAVDSQFWYSPSMGILKTARDVSFTELVSDDLLDDAMSYIDDKKAFKEELSKVKFTIGSAVTQLTQR